MHDEALHEKLSALLDGELTAEQQREVEALIASDPAAAREWRALQRMDKLFREMPRHSAPSELKVYLTPAPRKRSVSFRRSRSPQRTAWPLLAAAAVLVLVFGLFARQMARTDRFDMAAMDHPAQEVAAPAPVEPDAAGDSEDWDAFEVVPSASAHDAVSASPPPPSRMGRDASGADHDTEPLPAPETMAFEHQIRQSDETELEGVHEPSAKGQRVRTEQETPIPTPPMLLIAPAPPTAETPPSPPPAEPDKRDTETDAAESRRIGDRVFELRGQTWVQQTYADQETTPLMRDSAQLRQFLEEDPSIRQILALESPVILEVTGSWYRIPLAENPAEPHLAPSP